MSCDRTLRIAEEIKKVITTMLSEGKVKNKELLDTRSIISITKVDVVRDLKYAYIYVSVLGNDSLSILEALEKSSGYIRSEIGKKVKMRYTPELIFKSDSSIKEGIEMISFINDVIHPKEDK